ncbi:MAG: zinc ribbon domain-containing protein [Nitrososphaeraceae archaeon]
MTMPAGWRPQTPSTPSSATSPVEQTLGPEQSIWHNEVMTGIIHRKVVETQTITNYRVLKNNLGVYLKDLDDIVVMNQQRVSQSQYMGTYSGRYSRVGFGNSRSKSITVGDVIFMYQGAPYIIYRQINDPYGVTKLAKAARKRILQAIKAAQKIETQTIKSSKQKMSAQIIQKQPCHEPQSNITRQEKQAINISCLRCGSQNPRESKFCNKCGSKLLSVCPNCSSGNPQGSAFCNKCGHTLR